MNNGIQAQTGGNTAQPSRKFEMLNDSAYGLVEIKSHLEGLMSSIGMPPTDVKVDQEGRKEPESSLIWTLNHLPSIIDTHVKEIHELINSIEHNLL